LQLLDLNTFLEDFYKGIFNIDYDLNLKNLNQDRSNNYGFSNEQTRLPDSNPYKQQYLKAKQADLDAIKLQQSKEDVLNYLVDHTDFFRNSNHEQLPWV